MAFFLPFRRMSNGLRTFRRTHSASVLERFIFKLGANIQNCRRTNRARWDVAQTGLNRKQK
jgi:hypothetical protein